MNVGGITTERYHANAASSEAEQSALSGELYQRTSTMQSDKVAQSSFSGVSLQRAENRESFLDFYNDLLSLGLDDDDDPVSRHALEVVSYITERAFTYLGMKWIRPRVATDGGAGIRLTWRSGERELRAVVPASPARSQYLYVEEGNQHHTIKNFTSMTLRENLEWLYSNR
jgi:hypothetical protein